MSTQPLKLHCLGHSRDVLDFFFFFNHYCSSVSVVSDFLWPCELQHTRLPCPSLSPGFCSNSCPLSWWCHRTISSSLAPFSCPQSFLASGSFSVSWLFASGSLSVELQLQHQSFQWIFKKNNFMFGCAGSLMLQGLLSCYAAQASRCHGSSCYEARLLEHRPKRCSAWA